MPMAPAYASGGSISLTASRGTVANGGTVIIAIYVNGGGNAVNAVQTDLTYPASKLQYVGFSANGSAFEIGATSGGGDGSATLGRGTTGSVTGSGLLGTVTFKALAGSGSATIGVSDSSALVSDGNPVPYGSSGVTVNFGASAPATGSSTKATVVAPEPPKDTAAPVVTGVKAINVTPFGATISWTTSEPSDSAIDYGLDDKYGLSASSTASTTAHSIAVGSNFLAPLTLIHYRVKSADGAGNIGTSPDQTLQLPGVPITVIVRGPNGKPQAGAEVTLDGTTGTTDTNGKVILRSGLGNKKLTTSYQGVTIQRPITVTKSVKPLPPVQLDLAKKPLNHWMLSTVGLLVLVLALLAIDASLFGSKILARLTGIKFKHPAAQTGDVAVIATVAATPIAPKQVRTAPTAPPAPPISPIVAVPAETPFYNPAPIFTDTVLKPPMPVVTAEPAKPTAPVAPSAPSAVTQIPINHDAAITSVADIAQRLKPAIPSSSVEPVTAPSTPSKTLKKAPVKKATKK